MARPLRIEYPGAFYHVMARGNEKRAIFLEDEDRGKFFSWMTRAFQKFHFWVHAYALLGNHYHLYVETPNGGLSDILHFVNGGYTQYFNRKYERVGHLFQGRYKAILVERDSYSLELVRYIHSNPVKAGLVQRPESYLWSSYPNYLGLRERPAFLKTDWVLSQFSDLQSVAKERLHAFTLEGLRRDDPLEEKIWKGAVLGRTPFIEWVKEKFLKRETPPDPELPLLKEGWKKPEIAEIEKRVGQDPSLYTYFLWKYSTLKLKEIADRIGGGHPSKVTQRARRVEEKMAKSAGYRERIVRIEEELLSNVKA